MKKLLMLGAFLLIIAATARQKPTNQLKKINTPAPTVSGSVSVLSDEVNELDSTLSVLSQVR